MKIDALIQRWAAMRLHKTGSAVVFLEKIKKCTRGHKFRDILIAKKNEALVPGCKVFSARKNYSRLCAKYPEIMQKLGLNEFSTF